MEKLKRTLLDILYIPYIVTVAIVLKLEYEYGGDKK